jgi:DNA-binding response OmpR family regulator
MEPANPLVLAVDDEIEILDLIALALNQSGCRTIKALSAEEALRLARETEPDVLVTDLDLPGMSGFQLAAQFLRLHPLTRILFVSGCPRHTIFDLDDDIFPFPFLAKPFQLYELRASVRKLLVNMNSSGLSETLDHEKSTHFAG